MKAFIIHTINKKSLEYANKCKDSFKNHSGWQPELYKGVTVRTLPNFEKRYHLKIKEKSRAMNFYNEKHPMYSSKKSCSLNHYRLFKKCVSLKKPIAVIEHDSHCIGNWEDLEFEDILVLNAESAIKQRALKYIWKHKNTIPKGLTDIKIEGLTYRHDPEINGAYLIPGTAAYAVTPQGAKKMIDVYENIGWDQSDFIINTAYVRIQVLSPELFTFKLPNLKMSHGI